MMKIGKNKYGGTNEMIIRQIVFTILVSMIPAVEVKGAIPFGGGL